MNVAESAPIQVAMSGAVAATAFGAVVGTPGYMSPEQAQATTSIIAPMSAALVSTTMGVDASQARRAPARDVPPELDDLCVRATALDRNDRPATVRALSDAVEAFLDGDRDLELTIVAATMTWILLHPRQPFRIAVIVGFSAIVARAATYFGGAS